MRYADPSLCPDCRSPLPFEPTRCASCALLLDHPVAGELLGVLRRADEMLTTLRGLSVTAATEVTTATTAAPLPAYPASARPTATPRPTGVRTTSVPRLLLGLGALCLLVASVVFLAVSWSLLGVAGRTVALAVLTGLAGAGAGILARRGLRTAAESLSLVALGLLCLDVLGAAASGWFGTIGAAGTAVVAGASVLGAGLAATLASSRPLLAPQVVAAPALSSVAVGLAAMLSDLTAGHLVLAVAGGIALVTVAAARAEQAAVRPVLVAVGLVAALVWGPVTLLALGGLLEHPTVAHLLTSGDGRSLLGSAVWLLAPGLALRPLLVPGLATSALLLTGAVVVPAVDEPGGVLGAVLTIAVVAWTAARLLLPARLDAVALPSLAAGAGLLALGIGERAADVADRWSTLATTAVMRQGLDLRLPRPAAPEPGALPGPMVVLATICVVAAVLACVLRTPERLREHGAVAGLALVVATALASALALGTLDVALAAPVGVVALVAIAAAAASVGDSSGPVAPVRVPAAAMALALTALAALAALPSAPLLVVAAGAGTVVAGALALVAPSPVTRGPAHGATALLLGGTAAGVVATAGGGTGMLAVPVLLATGLWALVRPRVEAEVGAVLASVFVLPFSWDAFDGDAGFTALWLCLAGSLVAATAVVHPHRRRVAPAGAALLLLATWFRLADLSVSTPEAYTLPAAGLLIALGLHRLRVEDVSTRVALLPGLTAATTPSLLWAAADPVSVRALLLGAACLALAAAGSALRWSAPLVVGTGVGAALALVELGPYAAAVPTWIWIGLAGVTLTVLGTTWERRLLQVDAARAAVGRLR